MPGEEVTAKNYAAKAIQAAQAPAPPATYVPPHMRGNATYAGRAADDHDAGRPAPSSRMA